VALIMVDGRSGLTAADEHVAELARKHAKRTFLVVNKSEGLDTAIAGGEFHRLGMGEPLAISAAHGDRVSALMDIVLEGFEASSVDDEALDLAKGQELTLPEKGTKLRLPEGQKLTGYKQFARTPFLASFQAGWFKFTLATVHLYYGSDRGPGLARRTEEIAAVSAYFAQRSTSAK